MKPPPQEGQALGDVPLSLPFAGRIGLAPTLSREGEIIHDEVLERRPPLLAAGSFIKIFQPTRVSNGRCYGMNDYCLERRIGDDSHPGLPAVVAAEEAAARRG